MSTCLAVALMMSLAPTGDAAIQTKRPVILAQASISCGLAPLPPLGCRVGSCQCDETGTNCRWTFVCN